MNINEWIKNVLRKHGRVNVIISGTTCAGKTTLAKGISDYYRNEYSTKIISQDDYFKNLPDIPRSLDGYLTDSIEAFHTTEFKRNVELLQRIGFVLMPYYDISTNTRTSQRKRVTIGDINVFEGLHTIQLLKNLDKSIKIYIDTDIETCLKRRIERDTSKYGIPEERIREYWKDCIVPMCEKYIYPQKEIADIIIK